MQISMSISMPVSRANFLHTQPIGRIERMSTDTTVAKLHSAVAFRMGWQYARFERSSARY